jgi:hypothetical protein
MKQYEAVIKVMEENGGYATLGYLYQNALKVLGCEWKTKTPFASMRRIVQDDRFFFKIKPGLWALKSHRHLLPDEMLAKKDKRTRIKYFLAKNVSVILHHVLIFTLSHMIVLPAEHKL